MEPTRNEPIPNPAVRRLSLYLRQLQGFKRKGRKTISSKQLGESLNFTDAQVRKDFAYFGQFGHPGIGYRVDELIGELRKILGTDKEWNVAIIGAGNLGRALLAYNGFEAKGFRIAALFDSDPDKIGKKHGSFDGDKREFIVQNMNELKTTIERQSIRLAILAVPTEAAQAVANLAVEAGIRGILNFAPVSLNLPPEIALTAVDLAVQLEQLSFQVNFSALLVPEGK